MTAGPRAVVSVEKLIRAADDDTFMHAMAHVSAGRVGALSRSGMSVSARVADTPGRRPSVTPASRSCGCGVGRRGRWCEHSVAVALADLVACEGIEAGELMTAWFDRSAPAPASQLRAQPVAASPVPAAPVVWPPWRSAHEDWQDEDGCDDPDYDAVDAVEYDIDGNVINEDDRDAAVRDPIAEAVQRFGIERWLEVLTAEQLRSLLLALSDDIDEVKQTLTGLSLAVPRPVNRA